MEMHEFIPEVPSFTLSSTGRAYELRLPNLEDRVAMVALAGGQENVQKIFTELKWDVIAKIVYRLMVDKSDFVAVQETSINDEGVKVTRTVTGPMLLMRAIVSNEDSMKVLGAFTSAITVSEPAVRQYIKDEVKKNLLNLGLSTGQSSSTSSPASTDTLQPSSEPLPTAS